MAQGVSKCNIEFKMRKYGGSTKLNYGGRSPPKKFRSPPPPTPQCAFENGIALRHIGLKW